MHKPLVIGLGEILWDLLPGGRQMGGAPANFAYNAHALGAEARVISRVGNDPLGREILGRLHGLGLATDNVAVDSRAPTGTVSVELAKDGQPRFTIHENVAWDRIAADASALALAARADAVCFGSLAQRSEPSRTSIQALVKAVPAPALRIFDINLRQHFYSRDIVVASLGLASALKINDTELPVVAELLKFEGGTPQQMAQLARCYELRLVALTRGAGGSLLYSNGQWSEHSGLPVSVKDTVGAGDAFTAALALDFLAGRPLEAINDHANRVAAYVCTQSGATPELPAELTARA